MSGIQHEGPGAPAVFLNGQFVDRGDARVSAFDAGVQHGVGLFETMFAGEGGALHVHEHVDRLVASARALGLSDSLRAAALEEAVRRTVERARERAAGRLRLRLTITGGDLNLLERGGASRQDPTVLIAATPATRYPPEMFERGVGVVVADLRVNPLDPFAGHKTLNYWGRLRELQLAAGKRAGEALVFQVTNHLAGGCVSNAILVKAGALVTPIARGEEDEVARGEDEASRGRGAVMPSPVLPGITRRWAMDWARGAGMDVQRRMVRIEDVLAADELMLTNSSWGVLPVVKVEAEAIGDGVVGPITRKLGSAWRQMTGE